MRRLVVLVLVALAIPTTAAYAALSGSGGGTTIANGQATLVSNTSSPFSFLTFNDLNGQSLSSVSELSADVLSATYGGGSPRFSISLSNGTTTANVFLYLGDSPNYTTGGTGQTGNLINNTVDSSQLPGGSFYSTWADAVTAASGFTITGISFDVDGGWAQPSGSQTVVLDAVSINGVVYNFNAAAKSDCKNGNWQALGYKNQGACISYVESISK